MRSAVAIVLLFLLGLNPGSSTQAQTRGTGERCLPLAVATAPQTPGQPLVTPEVVLTSTTGEMVSRTAVEEPAVVTPTGYPGKSIVRSLGNEYSILDATTGTATLLSFGDDEAGSIQLGGPGYLVPGSSRYTLFSDAVQLKPFLVDLETAEVFNGSLWLEELERSVGGAISSDGAWLVLWTGRDALLIDLTNIYSAESLGGGQFAGYPWFSDDGTTLFFTRGDTVDRVAIVALDLASGDESILAAEASWFGLQHFPGDLLIVQSPGELHRIEVDGSGSGLLLQSGEELQPRMVATSGSSLLLAVASGDQEGWMLLNLATGRATELPELEQTFLTTPDQQAHWVFMSPHPGPQLGVPGTAYLTLDLETGKTTRVLEQADDGTYFANNERSDDGRYATVWSLSPALGRLYLIDAEQGVALDFATSPGSAVGIVSPDGCFLAVGVFDTIGEGRIGSVQVVDLETRMVTTEIEDEILLGWARI